MFPELPGSEINLPSSAALLAKLRQLREAQRTITLLLPLAKQIEAERDQAANQRKTQSDSRSQ